MVHFLQQHSEIIVGNDGRRYVARAYAALRPENRWDGWFLFLPLDGGCTLATDRETTQSSLAHVSYWAEAISTVYLQGALKRAQARSSEGLLGRPAWRAEQQEALIQAAAAAYARATAATVQDERHDAKGQPLVRRVVKRRSRRKLSSTRPSATGFARVGGMEDLKTQIRRIVETIHFRQEDARRYGVVRNGILLHGPPGGGKTFFAQAMAEEFGLRLLRVPLESAISKYVGGAPEAIQQLFDEAQSQIPCLLFFDEFDAIASKRRDTPVLHEQQMVNTLLQKLDAHRDTPGLLIVAATNRFEDLDPAVIREGRFDYKVKVDYPDFDARLAILRVLLSGRPHGRRLRLAELAHELEGFSAAQIRSLVDEAALAALEAGRPVRDEHLRAAYRAHILASRYGGVKLGWDDLILPADTKRKLQLIVQVIENPQIVRQLGITPPSGILLSGPPGTGKTTIARVLASETEASFFPVNAADIFSKWVGESEQRVKDLFARARARVPAIIFIDEIDSITERRGESDSAGDRVQNAVVNMFLGEMDGLDSSTRVFVIGATNRPELLDEALLRPGRLGERIEIPLPDATGRRAMLEHFSRTMRLAASVDLEQLAARTESASGALLKGLCTFAGRNALARELDARSLAPTASKVAAAVTHEDFEKALRELSSPAQRRPIGFSSLGK